ncbi:atp-binding cassette g family transporter, partial [Cystoisospora suis]
QLGAGGESEASLRHARRRTRSTELADLSARDGEKVAGEGSQVLAPRARHVPLDVHLSSRAASLLEGGGASQGMLDQIKTEKINILKETWLQFRRSIILLSRDPFSTYVKLFTTLVTALIPSFMFFRLTWDRSDAWNKVSASFYIVLSQALSGLFGVMMSFSKDRPIIQREYEAGKKKTPKDEKDKLLLQEKSILIL